MNVTLRFIVGLYCIGNIPTLYCNDLEGPKERYSPLVHWTMSRLASTNSLQQFARKERRARPVIASNSIYTDLFRKAQEEVGIAKEDMLPVVDSVEQENMAAATSISRIIVFLENFKNRPYGAQRVVAIHEAFHHKYHDPVFDQWFCQNISIPFLTSTIISTIGLETLSALYIPNKSLRIAAYIGSSIVSIISNSILMALCVRKLGCLEKNLIGHDRFKEYRADSQAVLHANCYKCVSEYDQEWDKSPEYLNHEELAAYISRFQEEDRLCLHHRSPPAVLATH